MTNEELLQDLKQFITNTVSQQISQHLVEFEQKMDVKFERLEQKIDDVDQKLSQKIDDVDQKLDTIAVTLNEQLLDNETRLIKLEQSAA